MHVCLQYLRGEAFGRAGDVNNRIRDSVIDALMNLADDDSVGPASIAAAIMRKLAPVSALHDTPSNPLVS